MIIQSQPVLSIDTSLLTVTQDGVFYMAPPTPQYTVKTLYNKVEIKKNSFVIRDASLKPEMISFQCTAEKGTKRFT